MPKFYKLTQPTLPLIDLLDGFYLVLLKVPILRNNSLPFSDFSCLDTSTCALLWGE